MATDDAAVQILVEDGERSLEFALSPDQPLVDAYKGWCRETQTPWGAVEFLWKGESIFQWGSSPTPASLGMRDGDTLHVKKLSNKIVFT